MRATALEVPWQVLGLAYYDVGGASTVRFSPRHLPSDATPAGEQTRC